MPNENSSKFIRNDSNNNLEKSKLIRLLIKLPPIVIKQFKAWYKQQGSPNRDAFSLLKYILSFYPDFESPKLAKEVAFEKIFGKIPYDYRRLMKSVSKIHLDLKQYLVNIELAENEFLSDYLLANVYAKYHLPHELNLLLEKKRNQKPTISSPKFYYEQMRWVQLDRYTDGTLKIDEPESILNRAMTSLDLYFLGIKLKYACDISTKQFLSGSTYNIQFSNAIQAYCLANLSSIPIFHQFYFLAWQLITTKEERFFQQLKESFQQKHHLINKQDQLILVTYLLNYTYQQMRLKRDEYLREAFQLFRMGIEKDILVMGPFFVEGLFFNIVSISCALNEVEWIDYVLREKLSKASEMLSPSAYHTALARLTLEKGDFDSCRTHLMHIDFKKHTYSKRARIYQIMCTYELKESTLSIESQCKSLENYLRRNETIEQNVFQMYLNFISIIRQLIKVNVNPETLLHELNSLPMIYTHWLEKKIRDLM